MKTTKIFSWPLFRQDLKSNLPLIVVILLIMVLMANVINFAMNMMDSTKTTQVVEDSQEDFFRYLGVMGGYNKQAEMTKTQTKAMVKTQQAALDKIAASQPTLAAEAATAKSTLDSRIAQLKSASAAMQTATKNQQAAAQSLQKAMMQMVAAQTAWSITKNLSASMPVLPAASSAGAQTGQTPAAGASNPATNPAAESGSVGSGSAGTGAAAQAAKSKQALATQAAKSKKALAAAKAAVAKAQKTMNARTAATQAAQKKIQAATKNQQQALAKYQAASIAQKMTEKTVSAQAEALAKTKKKRDEATEKTEHPMNYKDFLLAYAAVSGKDIKIGFVDTTKDGFVPSYDEASGKERLKVYEDAFDDATEDSKKDAKGSDDSSSGSNRSDSNSSDSDGPYTYTADEFRKLCKIMDSSEISINSYVREFEYAFAMATSGDGVFTGKELKLDDMMKTTLTVMGVSSDMVENMSKMDTSTLINRMYFTVMGLLPLLILIILLANNMIAVQVDNGSMAYILSTPTRRSAVALTQMAFMIVVPLFVVTVVCCARIGSNTILTGDPHVARTVALYGGMYLLAEAIAGVCYLGSCLFNLSNRALAFGGGLTMWFFLASLLGMFGSDDLVNMGVGVERLNIFNHLTLIGLFDINALGTVGSGDVDFAFVPKLVVLAVVAIVTYTVGAIRFQKKDLPL